MKRRRGSSRYWRGQRALCIEAAKDANEWPRCWACRKVALQGEAAHFHPLGAGRSRREPQTCHRCETELNEPDNLRWVCSRMVNADCHAAVDRAWAESGGCRK